MDEFEKNSYFLDYLESRQRSHKYFRLTGGIGNQLFGLSEAHMLHKVSEKKIIIDSSRIEHSIGQIPSWITFFENQEWFELVSAPEFKNVILNSDLKRVDQDPGFKTIQNQFGYIGWVPSLRRIEESGLFVQGKNPFQRGDHYQEILGCHIRGGDLAKNFEIGALSTNYYLRALKYIKSKFEINYPLFVHTDDEEFASDISKVLMKEMEIEVFINTNETEIETINRMSGYQLFIGANSTLSFWGHFFSNSQIAVFPKEFYVNDWNWAKNLKFDKSTTYITRFANVFEASKTWFKWKINKTRNTLARYKRRLNSF